MGASLVVRARTKALRDEMQAFLDREFRPWSKVAEGLPRTLFGSWDARPDSDVSYKKPSLSIGFGKLGLGWERSYQMSLARWIALKIGPAKERFSKEDVGKLPEGKAYPFIRYDDIDSWPVVVCPNKTAFKKLPEKLRQWATDEVGVYFDGNDESLVMSCNPSSWPEKDFEELFKTRPKGFGPEYLEWHNKYRAFKMKHSKPEIDRTLKPLRQELRRLDKAWAKAQGNRDS